MGKGEENLKTCEGCEFEHNRFMCEKNYLDKHNEPCNSVKSIHYLLTHNKQQK